MGRAFGFLCAVAALGSASVQLGYARAQGGSNSTQAALSSNNGQYGLYSNLDPTMAIVVVVTVCAFFMMGFFSVYIRHCSEEPAGGDGSHSAARAAAARLMAGSYPRRGLDPGVVGSFPVLAYVAVKDHKLGKGALECAICLAEFDDFDPLKILPKCEHAFHPECIDAWLASHVTCPVCRANQTPDPCLRHVDAAVAAVAAALESVVDRRPISQRHVEEEEQEEHQPQRQQQPPRDEVRNELTIDIGVGEGGDEELGAGAAAAAKLPKCHSTGHLLARPGPGPDQDRYALRLPEEVRRQIRMVASAKAAGLKRSTSYDVLLAAIEGSSRKGGGRLFAAAAPPLSKADRIYYAGDRMDGGDREFEVGEQSLSRLPV